MNIIDWTLYIPLALSVCYLFVYAVASKFYRAPHYPEANKLRRFVVLFPAYKEDKVIIQSIEDFLQQDYPKELFDIIVISDKMQDITNDILRSLPIHLLIANYSDSSKAKAMTLAMKSINSDLYDITVVMDADNLTSKNFLAEINRAFENGAESIQAHRTGKDFNTDISMLDCISEEINNGIFRSGHNALGLSAALSGSGMAFDAKWFNNNVAHLQTAGEDKELETLLLLQGVHTTYLSQLPVYDEKTHKKEAIKNQRKRWIAAQFGALRSSSQNFIKSLRSGNIDYCDKILQWMLPPRLIQIFTIFIFTLLFTSISIWQSLQSGGCEWMSSFKWWILSILQATSMIIPIPKSFFNKRLGRAILRIPMLAVDTLRSLFKLKGINKKFIHTEHGEQ